ncbi:MAG: PQQ-dependent sugar dehydrogenase [Minisyncoccia bacterium]
MIKKVFLTGAILVGLVFSHNLSAQSSGFQESTFVNGISTPTAMEFSPDGRLFVAEKGGRLRIIKNGVLLSTPFVTLNVDTSSERGLLGIAFDPDFLNNRYVYLYYTRSSSPIKNRVSRFTASLSNPDVAEPNSELILLDNIGSDAGNHNGGAIHFGLDGKLYIGVGDGGANSSNSQSLSTLSGKILRINTNGTIPSDNPFVSNSGARGEIWATGLRNPFTFAVDPVSGKIHINDVGEGNIEEVNLGIRGANYGWPSCEGSCGGSGFTNPVYYYDHSVGKAITGGAFYRGNQFPSTYHGGYFFSDYTSGFIKYLNPNNTVSNFITVSSPIDLKVGPDGALYYASINEGKIGKITYSSGGNQLPTARISVQTATGTAPLTVNFSGSQSSDPDNDPLTYSWSFGDGTQNASGVSVSHTYQTSGNYTATLIVSDGKGGTASATVVISVGSPPTAVINTPTSNILYNAGDTISYSGSATDIQDGTLPASALSWNIIFYHDTHTHPFLGPISGVKNGNFTIPVVGEVSGNVWYRIILTVTDSSGLTHQVNRDVTPRTSNITLTSNPVGLTLNLDGQPKSTPYTVLGVVGFVRNLGTAFSQTMNGKNYEFVSWSDGGPKEHSINTSGVSTIYTATFKEIFPPTPLPGDINLDHIVNSLDWSIMNSRWFTSDTTSDLNKDGVVNSLDFSLLNANWFKTW